MLIIGCDPGATGALAVRNTRTGELTIDDMPTYPREVGNKVRPTVHEIGLVDWFAAWANAGAKLLAIELVSAAPGQGAQTAFIFGAGCGAVRTAALAAGLRVEQVPPAKWKAELRCPKDKEAARAWATTLLPDYRSLWPLKGHHGRAEAAMIALYAERKLV